jgi:hypothetical protein
VFTPEIKEALFGFFVSHLSAFSTICSKPLIFLC